MTMSNKFALRVRGNRQRGFSLIEVMVAMILMTVGLFALLSVLSLALTSAQTNNLDLSAKQLANETFESIVNARDTGQLSWDSINNTENGGVFLTPAQPIYNAGPNGIYGTADDSTGVARTLAIPDPNGVAGTYIQQPLTNFTRTTLISSTFDPGGSVIADLKNLSVTIAYTTPQGLVRTYVLSTFISRYQ